LLVINLSDLVAFRGDAGNWTRV